MGELDELRADLARIDESIVELIAERQRVVQTIGQRKQKSGSATRDFGQEARVIQRARQFAANAGIAPQPVEQLMLTLIRASLTLQEQERVAGEGQGTGKRVLIVGGSGKMGRWFTRFLLSQGFDVEIADPHPDAASLGLPHRHSWDEGEVDHDMIVVATPLQRSNELLLEMAKAPPPGIVFDVGSLKTPLRAGLAALRQAGGRVTSVHPMFGPDTELLSGCHVIFVDVGDADATQSARQLFDSTMATRIDMPIDDHDRLIAYVLGLSHALNIAFFTALANSGEAAPELAQMSSTTFDDQLAVAARVAGENPALYFEIQSLNAFGDQALDSLEKAVSELCAAVRAGDSAAFEKLMVSGREYLSHRDSE